MLAAEFNFQEQLDEILNVLDSLVQKDKIDLIHIFVKGSDMLTKKAVGLMCTNKHIKYAGKLIEKAKINESEFPDIVTRMKKVAIRYRLTSGDGGLYHFIEVIMHDVEMLAILTDNLQFQCNIYPDTKKNVFWMGALAGHLVRLKPEITTYLRPFIVQNLSRFSVAPVFELTDAFGPRNPQYNLILPVPESSVSFIHTEEQLNSLTITSDVIGLDSEWKPTLIKFDKVQVSILQIADKEVLST
jgi:hypothetical protein